MEPDDYLTIGQLAEALDVSEGAVRQAIQKGRLPYILVFGRKVVNRADFEAYRRRTQPDGVKPRGRPKKSRPE